MFKKLIRILFLVLAIYLFSVTLLVLFQNNLVFKPLTNYFDTTPQKFNLAFENITLNAGDSKENIHAWWIPSTQTDISKRVRSNEPVALLYLHGNGAELSRLAHVAPLFNSYGLDTLMIDYRGYGKSSPPTEGLSETSVTNDALIAYDWLVSKGYKENKIIVWGHSLGSAVATNVALNKKPAVLVLEGALNSIYKMAQHRYWFFPIFSFMVSSNFDTVSKIRNIKSPLLSIHAENDTIVPFDKGLEVFNQANEPKLFIAIPEIDHNDFPDVEKNYHEQILEFFNKHLPLSS